MEIILNKKRIKINEVCGFFHRFNCMKFKLPIIKEGYLFKNRRYLSTYFFCQKVDVLTTDNQHKILYLDKAVKTEKILFRGKKTNNIYILPLNSITNLKVGDTLKIKEKEDINQE